VSTQRSSERFTYLDLDGTPDDGRRYEVINGSIVVTPSPSPGHQNAAGVLYGHLRSQQPDRAFRVLIAPLDWHLPDGDSLQPDILVLREEDYHPEVKPGPDVTPVLVVEFLSPSNSRTDTILKLDRYQRAGVPAYWIVDPRGESLSLQELRLVDGQYAERMKVIRGQQVLTDWPFGLTFDLASLER
jgi:Uma2 family endonuclease